MPKDGKGDPDLLAAWNDMNNLPTKEARQEAFGRMQQIILQKALASAVRLADQGAGHARQRGRLHALPHPAHVERLADELNRRAPVIIRAGG